jgi:L-fuconolactonase
MTVLDAHVHVWARGVMHPFQRSPGPLHAEVDDLRVTLVAAASSGALVIPSSADLDNDRARQAAVELGEGSGAIALLGPSSDVTAGDVGLTGFVGLRVNLKDEASAATLAEGRFAQALRQACDRGMPLALQLGTGQEPAVGRLAREHPDLQIVIDHYGSPRSSTWGPEQAALAHVLGSPNVFLKLSAMESWSAETFPFADAWPLARRLCAASDVHRLLWASNWPLSTEVCSYSDLLTLPGRILGLTKTEADLVLGDNARRLYRV